MACVEQIAATRQEPNLQVAAVSRFGTGFWETVRNIGWVSAGRFLRMGGSLVVGTMVVRYLGPTQYGAFSYAFAIYGLFNIVSNLGLDVLVVSEIALTQDVAEEEHVLGTAFWLKIVASVVTTIAAIVYAWLAHPSDTAVIVMVGMLSAASISQGLDVVDFFFQAKTRSRLIVLPQLLVFVLSNIARVVAVFSKASLLMFGLIASLEILASELALAVVYSMHHRNLSKWRFQRERSVAMLKASWPLLLASLLVIVYMRTDQVMLGSLSTKAIVGQYASASRLSEIWYAIPALICTSVMPRLLRKKQSAPELYYSRLEKLYGLMVVVSLALAFAVTFLGKYAVLLLFGPAYLPAVAILRVHIWTGPFVFIGVTSGMQLVHEGLTKISLQRSVIGAIANVALNLLLIPKFGGVGSAMATLITQAAASYLLDACNRSTRPIFWMKTRAIFGLWFIRLLRENRKVESGSDAKLSMA
ncbi:MAG: flippase [Janthinobacterium lividum]